MNEPLVSIVVPAYNAERTIKRCIVSLLDIDYPSYEIIIVDDGSTDKTKEILSEFEGRINIIQNQHFGPSKCRNIAVKQAKGEFIAFTDSDCIVAKDWLKELIKGFSDGKVVSVGGTQFSPVDESEFGKRVQQFFELTGLLGGYIKQNKQQDSCIREVSHNPSCNSMYRKDRFLEIGGFDENLWPGEDVDLDYRLKKRGYEFRYNPDTIVYHYRPQSIKSLEKMMFSYGVSMGILTKRYGFFRNVNFIPFIFIASIILFFINKNTAWSLVFLYLFFLVKYKNLLVGSSFFIFLIVTVLIWNFGVIVGLFKRIG
jgi:GT2 family glycosyltransferase